MIEQQPDFRYFDEIEWDDDGHCEIDYVTQEGSSVEIEVDPVTGQRR